MFKDNLEKGHLRYYQIAGVTIRVEADLPITDTTFQPKFKAFEADGPGEDTITISHQFSLPDLNGWNMGEEIYRKVPWVVYRKGPSWIYMGISGQGSVRIRDLRFRIWRQLSSLWGTPRGEKELPFKAPFFSVREGKIHLLAIANHDHTRARRGYIIQAGRSSVGVISTHLPCFPRIRSSLPGFWPKEGAVTSMQVE